MHTSERQPHYCTLKANPEYFGAYLNMARHNVFLISNHLAKKHPPINGKVINVLDDEEKMKTSFLANADAKVDWGLVYAMGLRFLPILKCFDLEALPNSHVGTSVGAGKDFKKNERYA